LIEPNVVSWWQLPIGILLLAADWLGDGVVSQFIAEPFDLQLQINAYLGQLGRNPHCLGMAVTKQAGLRQGAQLICPYILSGFFWRLSVITVFPLPSQSVKPRRAKHLKTAFVLRTQLFAGSPPPRGASHGLPCFCKRELLWAQPSIKLKMVPTCLISCVIASGSTGACRIVCIRLLDGRYSVEGL
jgi:hypothetical protein